MQRVNLSGAWRMKNETTGVACDAILPGSNVGNLVRAGLIQSPLISGDDKEGALYGRDDYAFTRTFTLSEDALSMTHICLCAGGFDTLCTCFVNGKKAFETRNAHLPVDAEIKPFLKAGENDLKLVFAAPVNFIEQRQKAHPLPKNPNGIDGIPYLRKPACHFGWDWGPCVPYCGVNDYIELQCFNNRIENIRISQETTPERAMLHAKAEGVKTVTLLAPDGSVLAENADGEFVIEAPELWYTRELSQKERQPLYTVVFSNDEDCVKKKVGLRFIALSTAQDAYGTDFCLVLNGTRVFAKGANLIPFAAIPEDYTDETVDAYLDLAQKANFNLLRVWGGGSYANEALLEKCDARGILVWQDFCFACQMYPFYDDDFTALVLEEVRANVKRLNAHACLALFCGNNEIEVMFSYLPKTTKLVTAHERFFYHTLPQALQGLTDVPYIPSSPLGSAAFKENSADHCGDTHLWSVWHGLKKLDYYASRYTRFLSEFGLESLPSMRAIETFASPAEYDLHSPAFMRHQKCTGGNEKMLFYLTELFDFPQRFEDLPYLTGIVQAECVKNATAHFRQNKGRCNGSVFWQFNDVWNCPSWSSVDFERVPKALQYWASAFFAPVTFTVKKEKGRAVIFAHNDTLQDVTLPLEVRMLCPDDVQRYTVTVPANSFCVVDTLSVCPQTVLQLRFLSHTVTELFCAPCKRKLQQVALSTELHGKTLTVKSDTFAYAVCITSDALPDDNYFSLLPGESRTVSFDRAPQAFSVTCVNNVPFTKAPLRKSLYRLRYRLQPANLANFFYYTFQ